MAEASIPVDLTNPGQVFACLGFLEAADVLCGEATGGFDWSTDADTRFRLSAAGDDNPVARVLAFLAKAEVVALAPEGWRPKKEPNTERKRQKLLEELCRQKKIETFPACNPETTAAMPIELSDNSTNVVLSHWTDGSNRNDFKLYSGNRSALGIAKAMLSGTRKNLSKGQNLGDDDDRCALTKRPFDILTPMGGSFNFDPRGAWTALDAGYSPNDQDHLVNASPVVEILAAWSLENARPTEREERRVFYAAWADALPPILARVALTGVLPFTTLRRFRFTLDSSGKNKIVTFAQEETAP